MSSTTLHRLGVHVRHNTGLLAGAEKRALIWLAERTPRAINSDHLSALGLAGMVGAALSFAFFSSVALPAVLVAGSLAVNWLGDSLDGTLARVRDQQRPCYGYYLDHVLDLAGISCLMAGLAVSGLMHSLVAVLALSAYLLVSAETYLATHARGLFRMSVFGFGPTELRILLVIGAIKAAQDPFVAAGPLGVVRLFDLGGVAAVVALAGVFALSAARNALVLYAAEPIVRAVQRTREGSCAA